MALLGIGPDPPGATKLTTDWAIGILRLRDEARIILSRTHGKSPGYGMYASLPATPLGGETKPTLPP